MPTFEDYTRLYFLGGTAPDGTTNYPGSTAATNRVIDDHDGTGDGFTVVGASLSAGNPPTPPPATLFGLTSRGDPIISQAGDYYILSNAIGLGGNIGFQGTGTYAYCFAPGTMIGTPTRERAVETLTIGDTISAGDGRAVAVKWVGRQTVRKLFAGPKMQPVCIRAGALGGGIPHRDLVVTADHGLVIDGLVINASALVNGRSIDFVPLEELPDRVTFYHIETEHHDVILANRAPAETFVDVAGRKAFDNYGEYLELFGADRIIPEMDRPRISSRRLVPDAIRARLGIVEPALDWGASLSA